MTRRHPDSVIAACFVILCAACASGEATHARGSGEVVFRARGPAFEVTAASYRARVGPAGTAIDAPSGSLALGPAAIARGERSFALDPASLDDTGAITQHGRGIAQLVRANEHGVEILWELEAEPPGDGDLVVRLAIETAPRAIDDAGVHFDGVRFGHGTWIDAAGERTPVLAQVAGDAIELRVPRELVSSSVYPAVLDPLLTPEVGVVEPAGSGVAQSPRWPQEVAVAFDGSQWLAVWVDRRTPGGAGVRATRIAADGTVLDPTNITIATGITIDPRSPRVAWDGAQFIVAWANYSAVDLFVARVLPTGVVRDPNGVELVRNVGDLLDFECAGTTCLMVYQDDDSASFELRGAFVRGNALFGAPFAIDPDSRAEPASIAVSASSFLVAYLDRSRDLSNADLNARLVGVAGGVSAQIEVMRATLTPLADPSAAFDGQSFVVAWGERGHIYAKRLSEAGLPDASEVQISPSSGVHADPAIACAVDRTCRVSWERAALAVEHHVDLWAQALTTDARIDLSGAPIVVNDGPDDQTGVSVAAGSGAYYAVFNDARARFVASDVTPSGARFTAAADPPRVLVPLMTASQAGPAAATNGTGYLLVWASQRSPNPQIYGARLDVAGALLDTSGFLISRSPGAARRPAVAAIGSEYFVVWEALATDAPTTTIRGQRVAGGALAGAELEIASNAAQNYDRPAIAANGSELLVAWQSNPNGALNGVRARVLDFAGAPAGGELVLAADGVTREGRPAVAANGATFLTAWVEPAVPMTSPTTHWVRGRTVTSGAIGALRELSRNAVGYPRESPALASDGVSWLVVHELGFTGGTIVGQVFDSTFSAISSEHSLFPGFGRSDPAVTWTRYGYLISAQYSARWWVDFQPRGIAFTVDSNADGMATNASAGTGTSLVGYEQRSAAGYTEVRARVVDRFGAPCAMQSDCGHGTCVDGVCCESACPGGTTDCMACSVASGGLDDGRCTLRRPGSRCRDAADLCDAEESCDGVSPSCPPDGVRRAGDYCRDASGGACDRYDVCDGVGIVCPERRQPAGYVCRAAAGVCDLVESCDGISNDCPFDARSTDVCRVSAGECDPAESCDGVSVLCPANRFSTDVCRAAAGACDRAEVCPGTSALCPLDQLAAAGTECRAASACNSAEACDGVSAECPTDLLAPAGTVCRSSSGACDPEETCDGASGACPADALSGTGVVCRPAAGACDVEETCAGGADCPADALAPSGQTCRASSDVCDPEESCDGASAACPADAREPDGTSCADELACNGDEVCESGTCSVTPSPDCDDGDPCTSDSCADEGGCAHEPIAGCGDDAGVALDAGRILDAGASPDAGTAPADGGCGCRATSTKHELAWLAIAFALLAIARRRRS